MRCRISRVTRGNYWEQELAKRYDAADLVEGGAGTYDVEMPSCPGV